MGLAMFLKNAGQTCRHQGPRSFSSNCVQIHSLSPRIISLSPSSSFIQFLRSVPIRFIWQACLSPSTGAQVCIINRLHKGQGRVSGVRTETPSTERPAVHSLAAIQSSPKKALFNLPSHFTFCLLRLPPPRLSRAGNSSRLLSHVYSPLVLHSVCG